MTDETAEREVVLLAGEGKSVAIGGSRITRKLAAEESNGAFSVIEYRVAPGFTAPPLHANTKESWAAYVLEGALGFRLGPETARAPTGSFLFFPRGMPFTWWNPEEKPARLLVIYCPAGFERYFEEVGAAGRDEIPALWRKYGIEPMTES